MPQEILDAWREIGNKGEQLEKNWLQIINKKNPKIKNELNKFKERLDLSGLESLIQEEKEKQRRQKTVVRPKATPMVCLHSSAKLSKLIITA